ncbi:MAG: ABC transporter substrate-binding protein, partial [Bdellovibrionota bacterium]
MDWNKAQTQVETYLLMNLMEGLASYDGKMRVAPALAKEWSISDDERVYTFKLRRDVKWSDGVPLKAADFLYSWKRLLSPATASPYAYLLFDIENAEAFHKGIISDFSAVGIKALDDFTLKVKLVRAVAHWIHIPTFWVTFPLREDVIQKHGFSWDSPGRMVTLGPYLLSSRDIGIKVSLRSNPLYYGKKGNIDEVNAVIIKDDAVALRMYDEGKLDFLADLSSLDLSRIIKARASCKESRRLLGGRRHSTL